MSGAARKVVQMTSPSVEAAKQRRIAASALPPIPPDHVRLTHNTSSPNAIPAFQSGEGFRFGNDNIGLTTDAFSTNEAVAEWITSGARDGFGPLTILIDLPVDEHNKRLGRFGWRGYEPVPNQNIIGHVDERGAFVPLQRVAPTPTWTPSQILNESPQSPYTQAPLPLPFPRRNRPASQPSVNAGPQILHGLLDPKDIW